MVKDPVCGMLVDEKSASVQLDWQGVTYYFCSDSCLRKFKEIPSRYLNNPKEKQNKPKESGSATTGTSPHLELLQIELPIYGVSCSASTANRMFERVKGVHRVVVNTATDRAYIWYDPRDVSVTHLNEAIKNAGYRCGAATAVVPISGMTCASCVTAIERALKKTPGVLSASVSLGSEAAHIVYLPKKSDPEGLKRAIESAGYKVKAPPAPGEDAATQEERERAKEYKTLMRKFWFAAVISIPVMGLSYPDIIPGLREWMPAGSETRRLVWVLLGVLTLPVMLWSGSQFYTGMWQALKHRVRQHAHLDCHRNYRGILVLRHCRCLSGNFSLDGTCGGILGCNSRRCGIGGPGFGLGSQGEGANFRGHPKAGWSPGQDGPGRP